MNNRWRAAALKELRLWPRWRLRRSREEVSEVRAQRSEGKASFPSVQGPVAAAGGWGRGSSPTTTLRPEAAPALAWEAASAPGGDVGRRSRILEMDWTALKACVAQCTDCKLAQGRTRTVFGVGDEQAAWLFVGEGPGAEEDARGEPFVGQAGKLLDSMLAAIGLKRGEDVYIANVVKCRPPGNRTPAPEEMERCEPYLERQIELIRPRLIIALGRVAAQSLLKSEATIASLRRKVHRYRGTPLIVTYHPAYLLRNLPDKAKAWEDLVFALQTMQQLKGG